MDAQLIQNAQQGVTEDTKSITSAARSNIEIVETSYSSDSNKVIVTVQNDGQEELTNLVVSSFSETPSQVKISDSLGVGKIKTVELNASSVPEKVTISHEKLPISDEKNIEDFKQTDDNIDTVSDPVVETISAVDIGSSKATIRGNVTDTGGETPEVKFNYGTSEDTSIELISGESSSLYSEDLTGLESATTYYFRAEASNSAGQDIGVLNSFKTDIIQPASGISRWTFEETTNDITVDRWGNNNGSITGAEYNGSSAQGENSILLGETDVVDHGSPIIGGRSSFTISVWIKINHTGKRYAYREEDPGDYGRNSIGVNGGTTFWETRNNGGGYSNINGAQVNDGEWHHIVGVMDSETMILYTDGSQDGSTGSSRGSVEYSQIGTGFVGNVDDLRLYDKALSSSEVSSLYENGTIAG